MKRRRHSPEQMLERRCSQLQPLETLVNLRKNLFSFRHEITPIA